MKSLLSRELKEAMVKAWEDPDDEEAKTHCRRIYEAESHAAWRNPDEMVVSRFYGAMARFVYRHRKIYTFAKPPKRKTRKRESASSL